jgi:ankyrin repeat protein
MITTIRFSGPATPKTNSDTSGEAHQRQETLQSSQTDKFDTFVRNIREQSTDARYTIDHTVLQHYIRGLFKEKKAPEITKIQRMVSDLLEKTNLSRPATLANQQYILQEAIKNDQRDLFKEYLKSKNIEAIINQSDGLGFSPLSTAVLMHKKHAVRLLLDHGADPNKPDATGTTPLEWTAYSGDRRLYNELMEQLPSEKRDEAHQKLGTLLTTQVNKTRQNFESQSVGPRLFNNTVVDLHQAEQSNDPAAYKKAIGELSLLVKIRNVNVDDPTWDGPPLLFMATAKNAPLTMKTLLLLGADIDKENEFDYSKLPGSGHQNPLQHAAQYGKKDAVNLLIDMGANSNKQHPMHGSFPLAYANTDEIAEILLKAGARANQQDKFGYTPLDDAAKANNLSRLKLLLHYGAKPTLHKAAAESNKETIKTLINAGGNPNALDADGQSPLACATVNRNVPAAEVLLDAGANVEVANSKEPGNTPLKLALEDGNFELSKLLVKHGADLAKVEDNQGNALHHAAANSDNDEFVDFLTNKKVDMHQQNKADGDTPLHIAFRANHAKFADKLVEKKANQLTLNNAGYTPKQVAIEATKEKNDSFNPWYSSASESEAADSDSQFSESDRD